MFDFCIIRFFSKSGSHLEHGPILEPFFSRNCGVNLPQQTTSIERASQQDAHSGFGISQEAWGYLVTLNDKTGEHESPPTPYLSLAGEKFGKCKIAEASEREERRRLMKKPLVICKETFLTILKGQDGLACQQGIWRMTQEWWRRYQGLVGSDAGTRERVCCGSRSRLRTMLCLQTTVWRWTIKSRLLLFPCSPL